MRDQIDGQLWVAHHDQFSESIDGAITAFRDRVRRRARGSSAAAKQLLSVIGAVAMTVLTFDASAV